MGCSETLVAVDQHRPRPHGASWTTLHTLTSRHGDPAHPLTLAAPVVPRPGEHRTKCPSINQSRHKRPRAAVDLDEPQGPPPQARYADNRARRGLRPLPRHSASRI
jgi:hypothetical protein